MSQTLRIRISPMQPQQHKCTPQEKSHTHVHTRTILSILPDARSCVNWPHSMAMMHQSCGIFMQMQPATSTTVQPKSMSKFVTGTSACCGAASSMRRGCALAPPRRAAARRWSCGCG